MVDFRVLSDHKAPNFICYQFPVSHEIPGRQLTTMWSGIPVCGLTLTRMTISIMGCITGRGNGPAGKS